MPVSTHGKVVWNEAAFRQLTRTRLGPVGRDLERRAIRVTQRMKQNASGRPGPNIRTGTLINAIALLQVGEDGDGLFADVGTFKNRVFKRGWDYSRLLEDPTYGSAARYPYMVRALEAGRD